MTAVRAVEVAAVLRRRSLSSPANLFNAGLLAIVIAMTLTDPSIIWNFGLQLSFVAAWEQLLSIGP